METEATKFEMPSLHHLMRVRIRSTTFQELQDIARDESQRLGEYTSVSDLVRVALTNWLRTHRATEKLRTLPNPKKG
jgi:hypothetical protein